MEKQKKNSFDTILFSTIVILSLFGLVMIFSASAPSAFKQHGDSFYFIRKQVLWTVLGFFALFFCAGFDYKKYKKLAPLIYIVSVMLLVAVLAIGVSSKGAKRWLNIGFGTIQPSEFTKIAIVITLAVYFDTQKNLKHTFKNVYLPLLVLVGIPCLLLILEPHFSVIIIIGLTVLVMLLIYGLEFKFYVPLFILGVPLAVVIAIAEPYRVKRLFAFIDPFADRLGDGWQIVQSLFAIGSGGLTGMGLSRSHQKYLYLSEPQNDYIYSIICEELGFFGAIFVIGLFIILLWRCIKIALDSPDSFGSYLAFGMGALIVVQVILNIGVATSSIPPTGVPLPFFSAGGTSFLCQMAAMGIVLNISRHKNV